MANGCGKHCRCELVAQMRAHGILQEITGQTRNRVFIFAEYLEIFDN
ncbi:hypothetical protein [Nitrosomonas ureae]|nr:hypothetical protein [Nitrosomonas ureae]